LARRNLLQHGISLERGITEVPGQTRFVQVHDVFAAARRGANENHPAEDRGAVPRHLLRDHSAQGESKHVAVAQSQAVKEIEPMRRHPRDCVRHRAG
jgi:hypothetical protein